MQQLLNLTESADNFARVGKGNDLSLKSADGDSGEFSRLMLKQNDGDKELQQLAAKIEAYQKAGNDGEGKVEVEGKDIERKNVGEPVTRNLWELLQQMKQESAEVSSEGDVVVGEGVEEADGELKMADEQLTEVLEALMAKLSSAGEGEGEAVMTDVERQNFADDLLAGMTKADKETLQAKLQQLIQALEQGESAESAVEDAGKFIGNLFEFLLPKADADTFLAGNEKALTEALTEAAERLQAQLSGSTDNTKAKPQSVEELTNLLKQLEQQVLAEKSKGGNSELTLAEQKKLQQFTAELRQLLAGQKGGADKPQALTQEQSAKAEQLLAEVRQLLKGRTGQGEKQAEGKTSESVITATDVKAGKEKAGSGDIGAKNDDGKQTTKASSVNTAVEAETKVADAVQQGLVFRNNTDALTDASAARAIQGQMVSTAQGTVAAGESSQANTLQALQRPLDLQQTEASQKLQERINIMMSKNIQRADIRLDPPELGSVHIRVNMNGEQASVQFQAQTQQARDALETTMPRLREMLEQQGINLADTQVGEQNKEGGRTAGGQAGGTNDAEDWAVEGEIALEEGRVLTDGQVDFYV